MRTTTGPWRWAALLLPVACFVPEGAKASCLGVEVGKFAQLSRACGAGTAYCYIQGPGSNTTGSIAGAFWAVGSWGTRSGVVERVVACL